MALAIGVIGVSLFFRVVDLENVPGINADEAVIAILVMNVADGDFSRIRTGTGNVFNPIHHGLVLFVHALAGPGPFPLRLPALISGVACVLAAWVLLSRVVDRRVALIASVMISVLPLHIAYSRLSQSPSATPLMSLICVFFAIRLNGIKTLIAFLFTIWVHPTNVFLLPILAAPFAEARIRLAKKLTGDDRTAAMRRWLGEAVVGLFAVAAALVAVSPRSARIGARMLQDSVESAVDPMSAIRFLGLYGDLLSGSTIYTYFTGSDPDLQLHRAAFWLVFLPVLVLGVRKLYRAGESRWLSLTVGLGLSLIAFYLFGGIRAISPHHERWAAFLTVPSCLVFAACLGSLGENGRARRFALTVSLLLAIGLLGSFQAHYFSGMRSAHGQHRTFRTGAVEPKQQALAKIDELRDRRRSTVVVAGDYWTYWPLRYLSRNRRDIEVEVYEPERYSDYAAQIGPAAPLPDDAEIFYVVFAGSPLDHRLGMLRIPADRVEIRGFSEKPVLRIHRFRVKERERLR